MRYSSLTKSIHHLYRISIIGMFLNWCIWCVYSYSSGLLRWHWITCMIAPVWCHNERDGVSITSVSIVCATDYSDTNQGKDQSSASVAFLMGIPRCTVNSPHKRASNAENVSIWWRHHEWIYLDASLSRSNKTQRRSNHIRNYGTYSAVPYKVLTRILHSSLVRAMYGVSLRSTLLNIG